MKQVKAFCFSQEGFGNPSSTAKEVNEALEDLHKSSIDDVDIRITSTGRGLVYTLI